MALLTSVPCNVNPQYAMAGQKYHKTLIIITAMRKMMTITTSMMTMIMNMLMYAN